MREQPTPPGDAQTTSQDREHSQAAQKGPDARRRPKAAGEAYPWYVEPAAEGANEADGPFSAARLEAGLRPGEAEPVAGRQPLGGGGGPHGAGGKGGSRGGGGGLGGV